MTAPGGGDTDGTDVRVHVNRHGEWAESGFGGVEPLLRRAVKTTVVAEDGPPGEISVTLLPLDEMEELNRSYLGRSGPTDVIAFDLGNDALLGDLYLAPEMALRAAGAGEAADPVEELVRLVVHGTLHLLGRSHPEDPSRWDSAMYRRQEELVGELTGDRGIRAAGDAGAGDVEVTRTDAETAETDG